MTQFRILAALLPLTLATAAVAATPLHYTVSWMGNSFSGKDSWILQDVADICVLPDGVLFTNIFWDEAGGNVEEFKDGNVAAVAGHTHGWGYEGGAAVAANSRYLFIAQNVDNEGGGLHGDSWPAKGFKWSGVSRRLRTDIRTGAPFPGGHGKEGDVIQGSFLRVTQSTASQNPEIRGLAADEHRLYVSCPLDNTIRVYDAETMASITAWHLDRPDKLCMGPGGNLWVLQKPAAPGGAWKALSFSASGADRASRIIFPAGVVPSDLCIDPQNRLLVSDNGPDQQIKIYGSLERAPHLVGTFGARGGILSPPAGAFGDRRFNHPMGVGSDAVGNLYIASSGSTAGGSTVLESYTPGGALRWRRLGLTFVDMADADPRNLSDVYTKEERFTLNPAHAPGQDWSYRAYTVNWLKYPDDPRLHLPPTNSWVRVVNGQKLLFITDMTAEYLAVYRFHPQTDGEIAIPCALFEKRHIKGDYPPHQPDKGEWIWLDKNGNGAIDAGEFQQNGGADAQGIMLPDSRGNIWQVNGAAIRELPLSGLIAHGVPIWDYTQAKSYPRPTDLDETRRLRYLPERDIMLLGGNKGADHNQHWKPMGPVLCLYDHWSTGNPVLRKQMVLPYEKGANGHESNEPISFDVAGDYIFVAYTPDSLTWWNRSVR